MKWIKSIILIQQLLINYKNIFLKIWAGWQTKIIGVILSSGKWTFFL